MVKVRVRRKQKMKILTALLIVPLFICGCQIVQYSHTSPDGGKISAVGMGLFDKVSLQKLHIQAGDKVVDVDGYQRTGDVELFQAAVQAGIQAGATAAKAVIKP